MGVMAGHTPDTKDMEITGPFGRNLALLIKALRALKPWEPLAEFFVRTEISTYTSQHGCKDNHCTNAHRKNCNQNAQPGARNPCAMVHPACAMVHPAYASGSGMDAPPTPAPAIPPTAPQSPPYPESTSHRGRYCWRTAFSGTWVSRNRGETRGLGESSSQTEMRCERRHGPHCRSDASL